MSNIMSVKSIFWPFKFRTKISCVRGWRWTPLTASIVFTVVQNGLFALRTISCYFVRKKFNQVPAIWAFDIENCIKTPVLCIISCAFSHWYTLYTQFQVYQQKTTPIRAEQIETGTKDRQAIWRIMEGSAGKIWESSVYPSVYHSRKIKRIRRGGGRERTLGLWPILELAELEGELELRLKEQYHNLSAVSISLHMLEIPVFLGFNRIVNYKDIL